MLKGIEIRMKVGDNWTYTSVKQALDRITRLVAARQMEADPQEQGYQYRLSESNDWWGGFDPVTRELIVAYRYAHGHEEMLEAFEKVLRWFFHLVPDTMPPDGTSL